MEHRHVSRSMYGEYAHEIHIWSKRWPPNGTVCHRKPGPRLLFTSAHVLLFSFIFPGPRVIHSLAPHPQRDSGLGIQTGAGGRGQARNSAKAVPRTA